jgi:hypothetical protein
MEIGKNPLAESGKKERRSQEPGCQICLFSVNRLLFSPPSSHDNDAGEKIKRKFVILRDTIKYYTQNSRNRRRENLAKLQAKNLPNLFWLKNPPNCRSEV